MPLLSDSKIIKQINDRIARLEQGMESHIGPEFTVTTSDDGHETYEVERPICGDCRYWEHDANFRGECFRFPRWKSKKRIDRCCGEHQDFDKWVKQR